MKSYFYDFIKQEEPAADELPNDIQGDQGYAQK